MAHFIEKTLERGEKIMYEGRLHWYFNFRFTVWGAVLTGVGIFCLAYAAGNVLEPATVNILVGAGIVACIWGLGSIFYGYFLRVKTEFAITDSRFIQKDGIFNIKLTEIPLFKIETVNFEQSFIERIVNTGSIELVGSGGTNHKVGFVQNPLRVRNIITTYMKEGNAINPHKPQSTLVNKPITDHDS
ncbi:MAG: PH domain-containing protein [Bacteroidales bacterium]|nr:PH domain-containing protein [Bacteroidales bacterium]MCM1148322.1 PH domain-containing protein [Bacteroidales bacterium]MCM1206986.1 PH domain-containing protein [Bacillota bacterium]MCM1511283.1 PH domain-containing protein [Clostridium sp.]